MDVPSSTSNVNGFCYVKLRLLTINSMKFVNRKLPFNSNKVKPLHNNSNNRCSNKEWNHAVDNRKDH